MAGASNPKPDDDVDAALFSVLRERAEKSAAERDAAFDLLADVVRLIDRRGYMSPEHQAIVRRADAALAAAGRRVR